MDVKKRVFCQKSDIFDQNLMNLSVVERVLGLLELRNCLYGVVVLAVLLGGLSLPATAQPPSPLQCNTASGVPPTVRGEGYSEQMGDLLLSCSGGVPTAAGAAVPKVDIQIFLNTNV